MQMIVDSSEVYVLRQRVRAGLPPVEAETAVYFMAGDEVELDELLDIYRNGGLDARIVEQVPSFVEEAEAMTVEFVSFTGPDGQVMEWNS
jgi:hypothetical protein